MNQITYNDDWYVVQQRRARKYTDSCQLETIILQPLKMRENPLAAGSSSAPDTAEELTFYSPPPRTIAGGDWGGVIVSPQEPIPAGTLPDCPTGLHLSISNLYTRL